MLALSQTTNYAKYLTVSPDRCTFDVNYFTCRDNNAIRSGKKAETYRTARSMGGHHSKVTSCHLIRRIEPIAFHRL